MSEDNSALTPFEWEILEEVAGLRPARSWGAAVGAAMGFLKSRGYVDHRWNITNAGLAALKVRDQGKELREMSRDIVERLERIDAASRRADGTSIPLGEDCLAAAAEITRLRAELAASEARNHAVSGHVLEGHELLNAAKLVDEIEQTLDSMKNQ